MIVMIGARTHDEYFDGPSLATLQVTPEAVERILGYLNLAAQLKEEHDVERISLFSYAPTWWGMPDIDSLIHDAANKIAEEELEWLELESEDVLEKAGAEEFRQDGTMAQFWTWNECLYWVSWVKHTNVRIETMRITRGMLEEWRVALHAKEGENGQGD